MALQVIGSFSICTGFCIIMVSMAFSGHISIMVLAEVESGVVRIHTSGDILVGKFTFDVFHICNEHCEVISTVLPAYRAATQDGGFAKG